MCIIDRITYSACTHPTSTPLFPCSSTSSCTPITRCHICKPGSCPPCHASALLAIHTSYARQYLSLEREARTLGWSADDIAGSLMEMQCEMDAAVSELQTSCGYETVDDKEEKVELRKFAEGIRFQFGPKSSIVDAGGVYYFKAGKGMVGETGGTKGCKKGKKMGRVGLLKGERTSWDAVAPWFL